jgi:hypothetical protein
LRDQDRLVLDGADVTLLASKKKKKMVSDKVMSPPDAVATVVESLVKYGSYIEQK